MWCVVPHASLASSSIECSSVPFTSSGQCRWSFLDPSYTLLNGQGLRAGGIVVGHACSRVVVGAAGRWHLPEVIPSKPCGTLVWGVKANAFSARSQEVIGGCRLSRYSTRVYGWWQQVTDSKGRVWRSKVRMVRGSPGGGYSQWACGGAWLLFDVAAASVHLKSGWLAGPLEVCCHMGRA